MDRQWKEWIEADKEAQREAEDGCAQCCCAACREERGGCACGGAQRPGKDGENR